MQRAYTLAEIDALRRALETRYLYGTTNLGTGQQMSRTYRETEKTVAVEESVRTAMLAGLTADDYYEADRGRSRHGCAKTGPSR